MLLRDYGSASPESLSIKYRCVDGQAGEPRMFFEVKRVTQIDRFGGWSPIVSYEEVVEAYEVVLHLINHPPMTPLITIITLYPS